MVPAGNSLTIRSDLTREDFNLVTKQRERLLGLSSAPEQDSWTVSLRLKMLMERARKGHQRFAVLRLSNPSGSRKSSMSR